MPAAGFTYGAWVDGAGLGLLLSLLAAFAGALALVLRLAERRIHHDHAPGVPGW